MPNPPLSSEQVAYLRLRAEGLIECLLASFDEAQALDFPSEGPRVAISLIVRALKLIREDLQQVTDESTFVIYLDYLEYLGGLLRYFDNSERELYT